MFYPLPFFLNTCSKNSLLSLIDQERSLLCVALQILIFSSTFTVL